MEINDLIRTRRLELGLTLKQVADAAGVSEATVCRWESGSIGNMRRDRIVALSNVLHLSPASLAGGEPQESIQTVFSRYGLDEQECKLIERIIRLDPYKRAIALKMLAALSEE